MKITRIDNKRWRIDFQYNNKRYRRTICGTQQMADQAIRHLKEKADKEKYGIPQPKKNVRFNEFKKTYIEQHSRHKRGHKTSLIHLKRLSSFFGDMSLVRITPDDVLKYMIEREKQVSAATVNREIAVLKTMFNKAIEWEKYGVERNPVKKVSFLEEESRRERILTPGEMEELLKKSQTSWRGHLPLFLVIALNTGMRKREILTLKWEHVDFKNRYLVVTKERSKSGKPRKVDMNSVVEEELRKAKRQGEYVFYNSKTGSHISHLAAPFKRVCKKAGIEDLTIHDLRHTAASYLVNHCGVDVVTVSKILGHSKIETTMKYLHPTSENRRKGVEGLGAIFNRARQKVDREASGSPTYKPATHLLYYN